MSKKKVLIFIDWYLPGFKAGGPIQSIANLVAHLKDDFEFSIVTRDTDYCETKSYSNVTSDAWNILSDGTKVYYFSQNALNRANINKLIRKTEFDIVYLNGIFSLYFTLIPLYLLRKKKHKKVVIAARGMFAESALGVKKTKKQFFLLGVKVLRLFDEVIFHATTENEKNDIRKALGDKIEIRTANNLPQKSLTSKRIEKNKLEGAVKLVNVARIAPEKNLLYALQILKNVKENVVFDFYGPIYNNEYWEECKAIMSELPSNIKANYKGSIDSEKVLGELGAYHFMFMPTRGENFGHIILQALSVGCPVIISDQTPWKHLYEKNVGWDISLDTINRFYQTIDLCAKMNQTKYSEMSEAAYEFAKKYIENPEILEQNKHLFIV